MLKVLCCFLSKNNAESCIKFGVCRVNLSDIFQAPILKYGPS
jgi:hypothetical protein